MEIRQIVRGSDTSFAARSARKAESQTAEAFSPAADRLELSRQWAEKAREQSARLQALLSQSMGREKKPAGILDLLDGADGESAELEAESEALKAKLKCMEIAMRIMKGRRVPPEDEQYLMENDPEGYKLAMAMRQPPKKDEKECESVLDDEDKQTEPSGGGEAAPAEAPSGGGEPASSGGEE